MSGSGGNNGNGGIKEELAAANMVLDNVVEVSVLALFFVQNIGKATVQDVDTNIRKIHGEVNEHLLHQSMEGLRARGLLSYSSGKSREGNVQQMYKTTKVKWAHPPEIAHIANFLPALVATEEARSIVRILNDAESSGKGSVQKAKTRLGYTDYYEVTISFKTKNPIIGSQVSSPYLEAALKKSPFPYPPTEKGQTILRFWRDEETGAAIISSDTVNGWLRTGLRYGFGLSDAVANYCGVSEVHLFPSVIGLMSLPVIDQQTRRGLGINSYEVINKGIEFDIKFRLPQKGLSDPMKFVSWMVAYAPNPLRGLSPARGKRFGKMEVIDYKIAKDSSVAESALAAIESELSDPRAKKLHMEMMARAKQYSVSYKDKSAETDEVEADDMV